MNKYSSILLLAIFAVFLSIIESCVPLSKYGEQKKRLAEYEKENDSLMFANERLRVSNNELLSQVANLRKDLDGMVSDSMRRRQEITSLQREKRQLENQLQEMTVNMDALRRGSLREASQLTTQIEGIQSDLQRREAELQKLSLDMADKQRNLLAMESELEKRNMRLFELERLLSRQDSAARELRNKVSAALVGLENNGLTISMRQGKVYVSLDEQLLFRSGSIVVDPAGVNALRRLATILEQNPDINITVEGHTDNVPLRASAAMQDNWDLSVKRATSIIRILLSSGNISPERLTAAGRGEFIPVDAANTAAARQKNRRTEIILTPKLDELLQILNN